MKKIVLAILAVACLAVIAQEADAAGRALRGRSVARSRFRARGFRGSFGGFGLGLGGVGVGVGLPGVPLFAPQAFVGSGLTGSCGTSAAIQSQAFLSQQAFAQPFVSPFIGGFDPLIGIGVGGFSNRGFGGRGFARGFAGRGLRRR